MSNQLAVINNVKSALESPENMGQLAAMLGNRGAASFIVSALSAVRASDGLQQCSVESISLAVLKAAIYNLPIDPAIGMSWLIPRRDKGVMKANWQIGYKGLKQLALRTGKYKHLNVGALYEGQAIDSNQMTGAAQISGEKASDKIIGYFGYLLLVDGYEGFVYWPMERILAHKQKYVQGADRAGSAWKTSTESMYRKTVLTNLLREHGIFEFDMSEFGEMPSNGDIQGDEVEDESPLTGEVIDGEFSDAAPADDIKKFRQWEDDTLNAIVNAGYAQHEINARGMLNLSVLPENVGDVTAASWAKYYRASRDSGEDTKAAAKIANERYTKAMEK